MHENSIPLAEEGAQEVEARGTKLWATYKLEALLVGDRIRLTPLRKEDSPRLWSWVNDRDQQLWNGSYRPVSEDSHQEWFTRLSRSHDASAFAIRMKENDELLGLCQLLSIHPLHRSAELRIRVGDPGRCGQGLGSEATRMLVDFGFRDLNLNRIYLYVQERNERAIRCYEKAGFRQEGLLRQHAYVDGAYQNVVVMGLNRDDLSAV